MDQFASYIHIFKVAIISSEPFCHFLAELKPLTALLNVTDASAFAGATLAKS